MSNSDSWSLTLTPHRSLSRRGYLAVMLIVASVSFVGGAFFWAKGAWPIAGFMGLDVLLIWLALRWSFRDGRRAERIFAEGDALTLLRIDPAGRATTTRFNRCWVRVDLERDLERELIGRLFLRSHGKLHEIASFLGAEERLSLAEALRKAI